MKKIFLRIFSIVLVFALGAIFFKEMLPECRPNPIQATRTLKYIGLEPQIDGIDLTETSLHWQTSDTSPTIHVLIPYPLRTIELSEIAIGASAFIDRTSLRIFSGEVKYLSEEVGDIWYEAVRIDSLTKKEREPVDCSILANTDAYKQCIWATEDDLGVDAMEENSEPEWLEMGQTGNAIRTLEYQGQAPANELSFPEEYSGMMMAVFNTPNGFPSIHLYILEDRRILLSRAGKSNITSTGELYIFSGEVKYLDAGAGNRWYEATRIDALTRVRSPSKTDF